jgi:carboxypeptidase C (cathepsin A)
VAGPAEEKISQTSHVLRMEGKEIKYTATTGTLPIRLDDGKVAARMFFVAYTRDGENARTRPVSFLYNGGPGAASVWLHMGSFAPKRVQMAEDGYQPTCDDGHPLDEAYQWAVTSRRADWKCAGVRHVTRRPKTYSRTKTSAILPRYRFTIAEKRAR